MVTNFDDLMYYSYKHMLATVRLRVGERNVQRVLNGSPEDAAARVLRIHERMMARANMLSSHNIKVHFDAVPELEVIKGSKRLRAYAHFEVNSAVFQLQRAEHAEMLAPFVDDSPGKTYRIRKEQNNGASGD